MLTSIPIQEFINPEPRSRAHNAIARAIDIKPDVQLIGTWEGERYFRVQSPGRHRHAVIIWIDDISGEPVAKCDCEAHMVPHTPTVCLHVAAALIWESNNGSPKRRKTRAKSAISAKRRVAKSDKKQGRPRLSVR